MVIGKPPSQPGLFAPLAAYSSSTIYYPTLFHLDRPFAHAITIILFTPLNFLNSNSNSNSQASNRML